MSQLHLEEFSLVCSVIWKNLRYSESISEGQRSTVDLWERHFFKQISQARDETVEQFTCRLRQRAARCGFAEFEDEYIRDQSID